MMITAFLHGSIFFFNYWTTYGPPKNLLVKRKITLSRVLITHAFLRGNMNTFLWMCIIAIIHGTILDDADVAEVLG